MDNEKMIVNFGEGATKKELIIRTVSGEDVRDKKIDDELDRIREIAPEIPILEV